jgi:very-short-patch-repair endonuclease
VDRNGGKSPRGVEIFHVLRVRGTGDGAIGEAAAAQRGLVHRVQLQAAGRSPAAIRRAAATGRLYPVLPAVYAVGHPGLAPWARELAVMLHLRRDAVISHRSAAALWGLLPAISEPVQATVIGRDTRVRPGLVTYRVRGLDPADVRIRHFIPITAPARTLLDLSAAADDREFERAASEARVLRLVTDAELTAAAARCPLRTGAARLRSALEAHGGPAPTRSEAERRLASLIERAQLPRPVFGVHLCGYEIDALWREARLVVEVDGLQFHGHQRAFERDRRRDQILVAAGYRVIRVTWRQITGEPIAVAARLAQALVWDRTG